MKQFFKFPGFATIMVLITLISCEKEKSQSKLEAIPNTCNVSNPAEEIGWLKEAISKVKNDEYSYYAVAKYKGETVFYYGNCNPAANYVSIVRNCNGDNLGNINALEDELTNITILWKHPASKCFFR